MVYHREMVVSLFIIAIIGCLMDTTMAYHGYRQTQIHKSLPVQIGESDLDSQSRWHYCVWFGLTGNPNTPLYGIITCIWVNVGKYLVDGASGECNFKSKPKMWDMNAFTGMRRYWPNKWNATTNIGTSQWRILPATISWWIMRNLFLWIEEAAGGRRILRHWRRLAWHSADRHMTQLTHDHIHASMETNGAGTFKNRQNWTSQQICSSLYF